MPALLRFCAITSACHYEPHAVFTNDTRHVSWSMKDVCMCVYVNVKYMFLFHLYRALWPMISRGSSSSSSRSKHKPDGLLKGCCNDKESHTNGVFEARFLHLIFHFKHRSVFIPLPVLINWVHW